jgi:hypothetical protein
MVLLLSKFLFDLPLVKQKLISNMKKFYSTIITMVTLLGLVSAQSPDSLSFQAVIRGGDGSLVTNQSVSAKITILQGSETGTPVYTETHTATTNENGLLTLFVGGGTSSDDFTAIDWGAGSYFIKREIDPNGGTNYLISGTGQFLSVPYALYALKSGTGDNLGDHEATKNIDLNGFTLVDSLASNSDPMKILVENNDADIEIKSYDEIYITTVDGMARGLSDPDGIPYSTAGDIELWSDDDIIIQTTASYGDDIEITSADDINLTGEDYIKLVTNDEDINLTAGDDINLTSSDNIVLTASGYIKMNSGSGENLTIESGNDIELIFYDDPLDYVEIWRGRDHFLYTLPNTEGEEGQILIRQGTASGATSERFTQWTPYKLPLSDGTAGQVLTTDGTGNVTWVTNSTTAKTIQRIDIQQKELDEMKEKLQSLNNTVLNQNELIQEMRELIREQAQMLSTQAKVLEAIKKNKKD